MRAPTTTAVLLLAISSTAVATAPQPPNSKLLGIPRSLQSHYAGEHFKCLDGSKTISSSQVNDDYCDCADGSDEPGTAACPNGRFFCVNKGFRGLFLHSSVVNDGVCDCCDGSDEYASKAICKNTCESDGAAWRETRAAAVRTATDGARQRLEYEAIGKRAVAERASRISTVSSALTEAKAALDAAEKAVSVAEEAEDKVTEERKAQAASSDESIARALKIDTFSREALLALLFDFARDMNNGPALADLVKSRLAAAAQPGAPLDESIAWPADAPEASEYHSPEGDAARGALAAAREKHTTLEGDLNREKEDERTDYGPSGVFFKLKGACFDVKVNQYTYQACPFGAAKQDHTSLGTFSGWGTTRNGPGAEVPDYSVMKFTGGQSCWNGPSRSLTVTLECGAAEILSSIDEPEKCTYTAKLATPAACDAGAVRELSLEVDEPAPGSADYKDEL